ncbi:chromatin assembly factor 1 subunit FSM isoform X3 [Zea mays]|uniref:chromatin assembly factor 1 subunit FSM isoform X3 n=1 Tax=Zea mays TaxID=4577 RepID=UPI0009A9BA66|nr:chromatin assembly factor 1 subunit FSM isoform X3 [Zea mays]|eukprot:XP_020396779.1 chromatin assembly factor 1 subunit FSM isoform X3 [Zea mays]
MDGDKVKESAPDCASGAAEPTKKQDKRKRAYAEFDVVDKKSVSAEWQQEMDALYKYYKEVSGHQLNPEELSCTTNDSIIACLLEESSLSCAKLTDGIYKRMKLQYGVTESSVRTSVLNIGRRSSYGISAMDVNGLEDESDSSLWCWETEDLALLPLHLRSSLSIRRTARKLIHKRILVLSGKLATKDASNACSNQNSLMENAGEALDLDEIRSIIESKHKNDDDIKTEAQDFQAIRKAVKKQQMMVGHIQTEKNKKERELRHIYEKTEREAKRIERENKRLKKHQEEEERAKKKKEKEEAELKRKASIQKQANLMERFFKRKADSNIGSSDSHHMERTTCSKSTGNIEELAVAATSAMDCTLCKENHLSMEELRMIHVAKWRTLFQHNRLRHWGVRRSPKIQLFLELRLQKPSTPIASDSMSTPTKEQSSLESTGNLDITKLLDELEIPSRSQNSTSSSVLLVKKLLQFDNSSRPAYYGTWRKKSSTVSARQPFQRDEELNYDVESDEEWEEVDPGDPGERLSDYEEDDEKTMNEHDAMIDAEKETENSFIVPNDYLSDDEGMQCESVCVRFDGISSLLSIPGVTVEELNALLQRQKALHIITEHALKIDRPLVICNLDHRKLGLLNAEGITGMLKMEKICLQALCMKKYPGSPIIDVPVVNTTIEDGFCRSNKKSPRTPVSSKAISESDMPEFGESNWWSCYMRHFHMSPRHDLRTKLGRLLSLPKTGGRLSRISWIGTIYLFLQIKVKA